MESHHNANLIAMQAFRGIRLIDGRVAICRNHQIQKVMQLCSLKNDLKASRLDALLEATILVQVTDWNYRRGPSFIRTGLDEDFETYKHYSLRSLRSEGVSGAAIRILKAIQRKPKEPDSKYFGRVNRRFETKLLALAILAADLNKEFLGRASASTKEDIEAISRRNLMKLDLNDDLMSWFDFSVARPLYKSDGEIQSIRLITPSFEGLANGEQEFVYTRALVEKRLGTSDVVHDTESCPKCLDKQSTQDIILGHTLEISFDFARELERLTNFKWTDEPAHHIGPYIRRLPRLDDSGNLMTFRLILDRT